MSEPNRKITVSDKCDCADCDTYHQHFCAIVMEWSDRPVHDHENNVVKGTEGGTWFNTGFVFRADTPEKAFNDALAAARKNFPNWS